MKDARPHLDKLNPRGLKVVFIGYEPKSKAYRFYDPTEGRAHVSPDVIFDDTTFWQWNDVTEADQNTNQFTVEYLVLLNFSNWEENVDEKKTGRRKIFLKKK